MNHTFRFFAAIFVLLLINHASAQQGKSTFGRFSPVGTWRGIFTIRDSIEVPFNFEITASNGVPKVLLLNGPEKFVAGELKLRGDSAFVQLDQFDNELAFQIEDGGLNGVFRSQNASGIALPVVAKRSSARFATSNLKPAADITGTYDLVFHPAGKADSAVAVFSQTGNKLTATVLRTTGDSRYLEGSVVGSRFYLSSFIGSNPSYFTGTISKTGTLSGEQVGVKTSTPFNATANENAALRDPYSLTYLKNGYSSFNFSLPDSTGRKVSLTDPKFKGKVVLVTIGGTWCPNCMDEAAFLAPWYKQNKSRGVEVVALQFERQTDSAFVKKVLRRFINRFDIQYDVLFGGLSDKTYVAATLPALNNFMSFPTMVFIDKQGKVAKIHTGFSGPATGKFYEQFKKEFNSEVDRLLQ